MAFWHSYKSIDEIHSLDNENTNYLCLQVNLKKFRKLKQSIRPDLPSAQEKIDIVCSIQASRVSKDQFVLEFLQQCSQFNNQLNFVIIEINEVDQPISLKLKSKIFLKLNLNYKPSELEKNFKKIANLGYRGIAFNVEDFKRGYAVLAHKFGLKFAITGVEHERHFEIIEAADVDEVIST